MFDIISIGDTTLDVFLTLDEGEADLHCRLDQPTNEICFNYAGKIPVGGVDFSLGGNAANAAAGFSRLGFKTALYTVLGDDEISLMIDNRIKNELLNTEFILKEAGRSSYSTIINYLGERTILEKKYARRFRLFPSFPATPWLYLSSLGPDFQSFFREIADFAEENNIRLGFNPAQDQLRSPLSTYQSIIRSSFAVFLNKEEAAQLLTAAGRGGLPQTAARKGEWPADEIKKTLSDLFRIGPKRVVITDGVNGSFATDGGKFYRCGIYETEVTEKTGAGDAYAAGFMAALMTGRETAEAMSWGTLNAAAVITKIGGQAGLLRRGEMEEKLKENRLLRPVEI